MDDKGWQGRAEAGMLTLDDYRAELGMVRAEGAACPWASPEYDGDVAVGLIRAIKRLSGRPSERERYIGDYEDGLSPDCTPFAE